MRTQEHADDSQLHHLIEEHQAAIERQDASAITHQRMMRVFHYVQQGWITAGQAARILAKLAAWVSDEADEALYRAAVADLRQIPNTEDAEAAE